MTHTCQTFPLEKPSDFCWGANLFKSEAQAKTLELGKAGCDPVALTNSFAAAQGTKEQRLQQATSSAVRANLNGEVKKYAKDGQIYTAKERDVFDLWFTMIYLPGFLSDVGWNSGKN